MVGQRVTLKALTLEAHQALGGPYCVIEQFPWRLGRENRAPRSMGFPAWVERRLGVSPSNNDLYIWELPETDHIAREHMLIDLDDHGLWLRELGSDGGTIVEGEPIGAAYATSVCPLAHQDVVIVGPSSSPYVFKVMVEPAE